MKRFASKQAKVALLINSNQSNPGAFVKPDIVLGVVRMCLDAMEILTSNGPSGPGSLTRSQRVFAALMPWPQIVMVAIFQALPAKRSWPDGL